MNNDIQIILKVFPCVLGFILCQWLEESILACLKLVLQLLMMYMNVGHSYFALFEM
jgi:hypothetical protein